MAEWSNPVNSSKPYKPFRLSERNRMLACARGIDFRCFLGPFILPFFNLFLIDGF
uniref:Uncharacterized protein n=1 Tax=Arundo donax TaxID=35708 RepID=A0A0A9G9K0_ARUDO